MPQTRSVTVSAVSKASRRLLGGYRLSCGYARGAIAVDFATMRLWLAGHEQSTNTHLFNLPAMGTGTDVTKWPAVNYVQTIPKFWGDNGYANGLCFWRGKLWAAPRVFYAQNDATATVRLTATDGETLTVPLPKQAYSGFVKRGPGLDPLLGCGGYESGQGTVSGPTLATLAGQRLISWGWPQTPGANLEHWNERCPRPANYSVASDSWVGWQPRVVGGVLQGRWACDRVYSGGLILPEGVSYWPMLGTADLNYVRQTTTFGDPKLDTGYRYVFDGAAYRLQATEDAGIGCGLGWHVAGQELDPQGRVWLSRWGAWNPGGYSPSPVIYVYG